MYRKTLQTLVAAAALFAFAAPFAGPASATKHPVVSGKSQVKLAVTGQLSRIFAVVNDGNTTNYHHVSNQFSGNRVRFIGTAKAWENLTIGTRIEFQFNNRPSNTSGNVDGGDTIFTDKGIDEDTKDGSGIDPRYQDVTFAGSWGKIYVGKGDSASNSTSEVDLSGTILASNPSSADQGWGGSHFLIANLPAGISQDPNLNANQCGFTTKVFDAIAGVKTKNVGCSGPVASSVFSGFDGLSRTQRVRYDTPTFGGLKVSVGLNQGPIGDAAIRYSGSFGGTKVSAAVAWSNQAAADTGKGKDHQWNGSASILHSSGLNLTVAAGTVGLEAKGTDDPQMWYVKLGYKAKIYDAGTTNFYVSYQNSENVLAIGKKSPLGDELGGAGRKKLNNQSDATAWSVGVLQNLNDYATDLFVTFSISEIDNLQLPVDSDLGALSGKNLAFEDLVTGQFGVRVKF